jgi:hypothetical protein
LKVRRCHNRHALISAIVLSDWVKSGVHINAIGADSPGKQELDPLLVARSKVVVDSMDQCTKRGEIQTAIRLGLLRTRHLRRTVGNSTRTKARKNRQRRDHPLRRYRPCRTRHNVSTRHIHFSSKERYRRQSSTSTFRKFRGQLPEHHSEKNSVVTRVR